ncbi:hypothetical protein [Burkholderia cenocepacia]|uniref:hypothetical protein n=1 Tax=Burkholderia cenocepacia TaxID=95486 RepID=UPI002AB20CF7|nr:hypothetical protein [Burkholderia cenocepacia]
MKFQFPVDLNVFSPLSLRRPVDFLDSVRTYCQCLPVIMPEKWGWWEPLDRKFDLVEFERLMAVMGQCDTVYWKHSKKPKAEGAFSVRWNSKSPRLRDTHSKINLTVEHGSIPPADLVHWLQTAALRSKGHFAFMDAVTSSYREFAMASESSPYGDGFLLSTHLLRHWLPDVFWATIFGPPYVRLFGKDRLLSAPVSVIKELADEVIYLQLTDSFDDVFSDPSGLRTLRDDVKRHLGVDAFFNAERSYDRSTTGAVGKVFAVPDFELVADEIYIGR